MILMLIANALLAQQYLQGKVVSALDGQAVPYANLSILGVHGNASNEMGNFLLTVPAGSEHEFLHVSCIGYASADLPIDSLLYLSDHQLTIFLVPQATMLNEIVIETKRITAVDAVNQAINEIPKNYIQHPFNMEFYSRIVIQDPSKIYYLVESIIGTYRPGYVTGAENASIMLHNRTTGDCPLTMMYDKKRKIDVFPFERVPFWDIFVADMIGVGTKYDLSVFNPEYFKKLDFEVSATSVFEGDTVMVVNYWPRGSKGKTVRPGMLFISTKDFAIVRHFRQIGKITLEVNYRKWGDYYYPYFIKAVYPNVQKGRSLEAVFEGYIKSVNTEDVRVYTKEYLADWHMTDVPYDASYWNANYPADKPTN